MLGDNNLQKFMIKSNLSNQSKYISNNPIQNIFCVRLAAINGPAKL